MVKQADRYLRELDRELQGLPGARRREIVDEIAEHISAAQEEEGDAATPAILERLGDPGEIAAEARRRFGVRPVRPGWTETLALILLPLGGFVFLLGWIAGVVLLWSSAVWSVRDKLIGTLVVPGGLVTTVYVLTLDIHDCAADCTGGTPTAVSVLLLVVLVGGPIASATWLALRRAAAARAADAAESSSW